MHGLPHRPAWVEVNHAALAGNVYRVIREVSPAMVCAVVKADAYGHGAVEVALTALDAGAAWLAVAFAEEGEQLRAAGIAAPILVLSPSVPEELPTVVRCGLRPTLVAEREIALYCDAVRAHGSGSPLAVHLKVDTGMHRTGVDPSMVVSLAKAVDGAQELRLEGVSTHFATADELDPSTLERQHGVFTKVLSELADAGIEPQLVHCANSAAALRGPQYRHSMVRVGAALLGVPFAEPGVTSLSDEMAPVMSVRARASQLREVPAGEGVSYGLRYRMPQDGRLLTVPIGYADGVPRGRYPGGGAMLRGTWCPIAGVVTMDQLMVDCSAVPGAAVGDVVTLMGGPAEGGASVQEWVRQLGTIGYEVTTRMGSRLRREHVHAPW